MRDDVGIVPYIQTTIRKIGWSFLYSVYHKGHYFCINGQEIPCKIKFIKL